MSAELIKGARARASSSRLGKSIMREMDADILMIRDLADALETAEAKVADAWDEGAQRVIEWNRAYPLVTPTDNPYRKETT